ncbi:MAG: hypothetical protein ACRBBN_21795 [Methyloligellaceae bacterium]
MNHRPRRPGPGPSQQNPPLRGRPPGPPPQQQRGNQGHPPVPPQQGMPPVHPQSRNPQMRPPQQQINGQHPNQQGQQQPRFLNEDFSLPKRQNKPIPASVPAVDLDAISAALDQCANELDTMERGGRGMPPEPIDDLIVVDMYTPKEQIPVSRRQQAAQTVAMLGPAEEGARKRQNQLIQALKISPGNKKLEPFYGEEGPGQADNSIPEPKVFNREPDKPHPTVKKADELNPMLEAFEAAVYSQGPIPKEEHSENQENKSETGEDLSQDKFGSRLMPKSNAYKIEREQQAEIANEESGMSLDELHSYYASQKDTNSNEEQAAREAFLSEQANRVQTSGAEPGFLSGLGGSAETHHPAINENSQTGAFSDAGGFLSGVESGGTEQQGAFSSRNIAVSNESNTTGNGNFLDSLNAFNQPHPQQTSEPVQYGAVPLHDPFSSSNSISPEAKAYRDSVLYGDSPPPQVQHQPPVNNQAGNIYQQQQPAPPPMPGGSPVLGHDSPSFLNSPTHQPVQQEPAQNRQIKRNTTEHKRKTKEKISSVDRGRRKAIQAYFGIRPMWTILSALIGVGIVSSQGRYDPIREWVVFSPGWVLLSGLCLLAASIAWRYLSSRKPKEETLDDWSAEDLVNLERRAFDSMQLQNRYLLLEPIVMSGFPDVENIDDEYVNGLYGKDHILRYTPRALTVMCFTRGEILTYEGAIDLTTGQVVYEASREFFYSDVATIGMVKSKIRRKFRILNLILPWRWMFVERFLRVMSGRPTDRSSANKKETFQISLKDGSRVQLILRDARVMRENTFEELAVSTDEKVLKAITDFVVAQKTDQLAGYR